LAAGSALTDFDRDRSDGGRLRLAGVDEAGRGCWAGPVVAAAVVLPPDWLPAGLNDSKQVAADRREQLYGQIVASALSWGACAVSAGHIDRVNILQATLTAMARAVAKLQPPPDVVLVDGRQTPDVPMAAEALIGGDGTSAAIAAASIVAKVLRDRVMTALDRRYPVYGFAAHKGYGTAAHRQALAAHGPCRLHRCSYKPIAELDQGKLF
jgi:ribonuclease HII